VVSKIFMQLFNGVGCPKIDRNLNHQPSARNLCLD
jgi:hypothetical protein